MEKRIPVLAFTTQFNGIANALINEAQIVKAFDPSKNQHPQNPIKVKALWDTGATNSVITERAVKMCGLQPIGMTQVNTASGSNICPVFLAGIGLPNNVWFSNIRVTLGQLSGEIDMLIGMDIICRGDFAITHKDGKTTFSFRVPSIDHIDFVKQSNLIRAAPKIPRNGPCPCGSGKKYKDCHGKKGKKRK